MIVKKIAVLLLVLTASGCALTTGNAPANTEATTLGAERSLDERMSSSFSAYQEGRLGDSERELLGIVRDHPTLSEAWLKLGNIYYRTGQYKAAINAYESVIQHDAENQRVWYNLALTRIKQAEEVIDAGMNTLNKESDGHTKLRVLQKSLRTRLLEQNTPKNTITN